MTQQLTIPGSYYSGGREHEFSLETKGLQELAESLTSIVGASTELHIVVGSGRLCFRNAAASPTVVTLQGDGSLKIITNAADISELARKLRGLTGDSIGAENSVDHIHLEPWFMDATSDVTDIIFERKTP